MEDPLSQTCFKILTAVSLPVCELLSPRLDCASNVNCELNLWAKFSGENFTSCIAKNGYETHDKKISIQIRMKMLYPWPFYSKSGS
jgi:hypothetical protein